MVKGCLVFDNVVFSYDPTGAAVFDGVSARFPTGWTGVIGANGSGKTTLLRLACGELAPMRGRILSPASIVYCPQRTDEAPTELLPFLDAEGPGACELRGRLGVAPDWRERWQTLSHGERKRAQIAVALWRRPDVLAIDEPTNHIDLAARRLLCEAMASFRGIGLLVSHDRDLMDTLCRQCLFCEPPAAVMRPGGYTKAVELARAERQAAERARAQAKREAARLRREAASRAREAAGADRRRSKRRLDPKDHDAREKIDRARVTGKDGKAGRLLRQMRGRLRQVQDKVSRIRVSKQHPMGIDLAGARARRDLLFRLPAGRLSLGDGRELAIPALAMTPTDRVALIGPNSSGKSTLIRHIVGTLTLPADKVVYLAQEIDRQAARQAVLAVRGLPHGRLGDVMSAVSCLGSRPQRLLETDDPSPGEARKIMLALGLAYQPYLIIMDEPTNHLDLPSIECLESALADCSAAILLVSHDLRFLRRLTRARWEIGDCPGGTLLRIAHGDGRQSGE